MHRLDKLVVISKRLPLRLIEGVKEAARKIVHIHFLSPVFLFWRNIWRQACA